MVPMDELIVITRYLFPGSGEPLSAGLVVAPLEAAGPRGPVATILFWAGDATLLLPSATLLRTLSDTHATQTGHSLHTEYNRQVSYFAVGLMQEEGGG